MAVAIKIPPALRKAFDDEAANALIDVLNQFDAAQRNGLEKSLEVHFNAFKDYVDRRMAESEGKTEKRFAEMQIMIAQNHSSLLRWLFTFFIGSVATFATFFSIFYNLSK